MERLIDEHAVRITVDRQRARVDALWDTQVLHGCQYVPRAFDIDRCACRWIARPDLVPTSDVEDAVGAGHRSAQARCIGDVARGDRDAEFRKLGCTQWIARKCDHAMTCLRELPCDCAAYETGRACDEISHCVPVLCRARRDLRISVIC